MIKDEAGNELLYWPVGGIQAGSNSQTIKIQVQCGPGLELACSSNPNATVFGRRFNVGAVFVNLATAPIDLSEMGSGYVMFEVYVHAESGLVSLERLALSVGCVRQDAVAWVA